MKKISLICFLVFSFQSLWAQDCYLVIEKSGNYSAAAISGIAIPLINQNKFSIKAVPSFGIKSSDCHYLLNLLEDKLKTTVTISGQELNVVGESTLAGLNGVQQAILRGLIAAKTTIKNKMCISYPQIIPTICGFDLSIQPSEEETEIWEIIKDTESPEDIIDFINTYPNGRYRYLANHKLMLMGKIPVEIDRAKNGNQIQEKELWEQIKPRLILEELKYFLAEFPNGKKKRVVKLLIKKIHRDQKRQASKKEFWSTGIDKPYFNGLYYEEGQRKLGSNKKMVTCYTYYRFYPDGSVLSWFNQDLSCGTGKKPDDLWTLKMISRQLCKLPGCREELYFDDITQNFVIDLDEDQWKINSEKQLVLMVKYRNIKNGEPQPDQIKEYIIGPIFKSGIRSVKNDTRLKYDDPKRWNMLFIPYPELKNVTTSCDYTDLIERGKSRIDAYLSDAGGKKYRHMKTGIAWFKSAISCREKQKEAYFELAKAYEIKKRNDDAIATYLDLLKYHPDDSDAILNATRLYHTTRRHPLALKYLNTFLQRNQTIAEGIQIAELKANLTNCNCELVIEKGEKMILEGNEHPQVSNHLGLCYAYEQNPEKSLYHFKRRTSLNGINYTKTELGELVYLSSKVIREPLFKKWYNFLEKGKSSKARYDRYCLRKRKP